MTQLRSSDARDWGRFLAPRKVPSQCPWGPSGYVAALGCLLPPPCLFLKQHLKAERKVAVGG